MSRISSRRLALDGVAVWGARGLPGAGATDGSETSRSGAEMTGGVDGSASLGAATWTGAGAGAGGAFGVDPPLSQSAPPTRRATAAEPAATAAQPPNVFAAGAAVG